MLAQPPAACSRAEFDGLLNSALAYGESPTTATSVGPKTLAAIEAVAREHPDAGADDITAAYDAFVGEHG